MKPIGLPEHRLRQVVELEAAEAIAARKLLTNAGGYRGQIEAGAFSEYAAARTKAERARADYERGEAQ